MAHWVTPPVIMSDGKNTAIGEVNYGSESRMFVFAYRDTNSDMLVTDTSVPSYHNITALTAAERGTFSDPKYIIINPATVPESNTTEVPLIFTKQGVTIDTGLRLASNGQIVGRLKIYDPVKELVFKVRYIDPPLYTPTTKYRAYTHVHSNGRLYRLNANATLPYYAVSGTPAADDWTDIGAYTPQYTAILPYINGTQYSIADRIVSSNRIWQLSSNAAIQYKATPASPDATYWKNLGVIAGAYSPYTQNSIYSVNATVKHGSNVYQLIFTQPFISSHPTPDSRFWTNVGPYTGNVEVQPERIFRIVINTRRSSLIVFKTQPNLGIIKIGQQIGDSVIKNIEAFSDVTMSYELLPEHVKSIGEVATKGDDGIYHVLPAGLQLHADGTITGYPVGPIGKYQFDVIARNTYALEKQGTFQISVYDGYGKSAVSAVLRPRFDIERQWYSMITDTALSSVQLYRETDPAYGLRDYPEIIIKRNLKGEYLDSTLALALVQPLLTQKLKSTPAISCRLGNMRYRTALDKNGIPLYDLLYKELVPLNTSVVYDPNALHETLTYVPEILSLKTNLTNVLGSDDASIMEDELRGFKIDGFVPTYDDLQLWEINHNAKDVPYGHKFIVPVAYVMPGEAKKFIDLSITYGTLHTLLVNHIVMLDTIVITDMTSETKKAIVVSLFTE